MEHALHVEYLGGDSSGQSVRRISPEIQSRMRTRPDRTECVGTNAASYQLD